MKIRTLDIDELNDRLSELEGLREALASERENLEEATPENREEIAGRVAAAEADFGEPEEQELKELESIKEDIGERRGKIDTDGGPFVHEDDFREYAEELAEDIGAIPKSADWPCRCIDWEKAAQELRQDYSSVEYNGATYLYRAT